MVETPLLITARLTLRPWITLDAPSVNRWCGSPLCTKYLFWYPHRSLEVTEKIVSKWVRKKRNYSWAIVYDGQAIGEVEVIKNLPHDGVEIGYILRDDFWGQGLMSEALEGVLAHLREIGKAYCYAETDERNIPSRRLLERLGFQYLGLEEGRFVAKKNEKVNIAKFQKTLIVSVLSSEEKETSKNR